MLLSAFGYPVSGLRLIRQQMIRHKNIKPQNILLHSGSVIYTDFGISYDSSQASRSTITKQISSITSKILCARSSGLG